MVRVETGPRHSRTPTTFHHRSYHGLILKRSPRRDCHIVLFVQRGRSGLPPSAAIGRGGHRRLPSKVPYNPSRSVVGIFRSRNSAYVLAGSPRRLARSRPTPEVHNNQAKRHRLRRPTPAFRRRAEGKKTTREPTGRGLQREPKESALPVAFIRYCALAPKLPQNHLSQRSIKRRHNSVRLD